MAMEFTIKHPLMTKRLAVRQDEGNPTTWQMECPGYVPITFDANGLDEAMRNAQSLTGNLRLTEEGVKKREARREASRKRMKERQDQGTAPTRRKK